MNELGLEKVMELIGGHTNPHGLDETNFEIWFINLLQKDPEKAYNQALDRGEDYIERARKAFAEKRPGGALLIGKEKNDKELIMMAGWIMVESCPWKAYEAGVELEDELLRRSAGYKLVDENPEKASNIGAKYDDKPLMVMAGWALLRRKGEYPSRDAAEAYNLAVRTSANDLRETAARILLEDFPEVAYHVSLHNDDDDPLYNSATARLLEVNPELAFKCADDVYFGGMYSPDRDFLRRASEKLVEKPFDHYRFITRRGPQHRSVLIESAARKMLETAETEKHLVMAFDLAKYSGDKSLVNQVLERIAEMAGADKEQVMKLYS